MRYSCVGNNNRGAVPDERSCPSPCLKAVWVGGMHAATIVWAISLLISE